MRWGITPNITFSGAVNPDFSQIEADAVQLAINSDSLCSIEEKRPFFLESSDYFETGLELLYTRMIADPSAALKLTGKLGRHTIGLLHRPRRSHQSRGARASRARNRVPTTQRTPRLWRRYRYDLGADSTIGAMFTDREG